jgi:glycosyltransferase involved in cell wall biosynthesis
MKILIVDEMGSGVDKYRIKEPHIAIENDDDIDINITFSKLIDLYQEDIAENYSAVFVHHSIATNQSAWAKVMSLDIPIILDIDDYWELDKSSYMYNNHLKNNIDKKVVGLIKKAKLITTTTKYLAKKIKLNNSNVKVLPNSISELNKTFQHNKIIGEDLDVGMATGSSHLNDVKLLDGVFSILNGNNVKLHLAGFDTRIRNVQSGSIRNDFDSSVWKKYEEILTSKYQFLSDKYIRFLKNAIPNAKWHNNEKYNRIWSKNIQTYGNVYNQFDVALAPLVDNKFNRLKSELKIIEAGFHGIPILCSNLPMYADIIEHGVNGFLIDEKKRHKQWVKYIKILTNDKVLCQEMGENLRKTVLEKFSLETNYKKRAKIYLEEFNV